MTLHPPKLVPYYTVSVKLIMWFVMPIRQCVAAAVWNVHSWLGGSALCRNIRRIKVHIVKRTKVAIEVKKPWRKSQHTLKYDVHDIKESVDWIYDFVHQLEAQNEHRIQRKFDDIQHAHSNEGWCCLPNRISQYMPSKCSATMSKFIPWVFESSSSCS